MIGPQRCGKREQAAPHRPFEARSLRDRAPQGDGSGSKLACVLQDMHAGAGAVDQVEQAVVVGTDVVRRCTAGSRPRGSGDEAADLLRAQRIATSTARRPALK